MERASGSVSNAQVVKHSRKLNGLIEVGIGKMKHGYKYTSKGSTLAVSEERRDLGWKKVTLGCRPLKDTRTGYRPLQSPPVRRNRLAGKPNG